MAPVIPYVTESCSFEQILYVTKVDVWIQQTSYSKNSINLNIFIL